MKDGGIVSDFGSLGDFDSSDTGLIDFNKAKCLGCKGSTCDAYITVFQRRKVFVKRLKKEYRDNPLYRAAFDKEYDLGVSLNHVSLPRYIAFHDDYIVMDYIEGKTLSMILSDEKVTDNDRQSGELVQGSAKCEDDNNQSGDFGVGGRIGGQGSFDKRNRLKILKELVDVIDYLHRRGVVHCDIKVDNIIIPPYSDRPVKLIDLDKAYTSWLDSTHGNPANFGCDKCEDGKIDYVGLANIAELLGEKRFARIYRNKDVTLEKLRLELSGKKGILLWVIPLIAVIECVLCWLAFDSVKGHKLINDVEIQDWSVSSNDENPIIKDKVQDETEVVGLKVNESFKNYNSERKK